MMARLIADAPQAEGGGRHQRSADRAGRSPTTIRHQLNSNLLLVTNRVGQRAGDRRRVAARRRASSRSQPAVRDALAGRETLQPAAAARRHAAARDGADLRSASTQPGHPRHAQRRLPARRRAGGAAEGDHRQRHRVRHGRPDPGDDAAARRPAGARRRCCARRGAIATSRSATRSTSALPLPLVGGRRRRPAAPGRSR